MLVKRQHLGLTMFAKTYQFATAHKICADWKDLEITNSRNLINTLPSKEAHYDVPIRAAATLVPPEGRGPSTEHTRCDHEDKKGLATGRAEQ